MTHNKQIIFSKSHLHDFQKLLCPLGSSTSPLGVHFAVRIHQFYLQPQVQDLCPLPSLYEPNNYLLNM